MPAYLHRRFNMGHPYLRTVCAIFILLFFLFWASGLIAGGKLFETVFGWDYRWAVIIGAAAVSTADSQLLVSSAALAEDICHVRLGRETSPEAMVKVGR